MFLLSLLLSLSGDCTKAEANPSESESEQKSESRSKTKPQTFTNPGVTPP